MWLFKVSIIGIAMLLAFDHATQACASEETEQEQILRISRRAIADQTLDYSSRAAKNNYGKGCFIFHYQPAEPP